MDKNEKIKEIKELYKGYIDEAAIDMLAKMVFGYGGKTIARLAMDLDDSLNYDIEPAGPNSSEKV